MFSTSSIVFDAPYQHINRWSRTKMMKTCKQLAEEMLVSRSTVYRAMEDGRIAAVPAGRLKRITDEEFARVLRDGIPEATSRMRDAH
jgi:excisionase family DNA binding protein